MDPLVIVAKLQKIIRENLQRVGDAMISGSVYIGSAIKTEYGGKKLSNKSYEKYYKGMI